jgi:hypothetical protein
MVDDQIIAFAFRLRAACFDRGVRPGHLFAGQHDTAAAARATAAAQNRGAANSQNGCSAIAAERQQLGAAVV